MTDTNGREVSKYSVARAAASPESALLAVIRRISIANTVEEIVETLTPAAREMLGADGVTFVLRDGEECHYVEEDAVAPLWKGRRFPLDACISGWCMKTGEPAAIPDITLDPRIPQEAYRPTFVKSLAMVPVRQDDPLAAMGAYWATKRQVTEDELELLQALANAAALGMVNIGLADAAERAGTARRELSHRIRNVLSVVRVLARRTARTAGDPQAFETAFFGRLEALGRAQGMLDDPEAAGAQIDAIVRDQAIVGGDEDRIRMNGPSVPVPDSAAFDLGLLLHELGTNARKYGALSNDEGTVHVEWAWKADGGHPTIELSWIERGGPPVTPPAEAGFGSSLLRHAFAQGGGGASIDYPPDGVVCRMSIPAETSASDIARHAVDGHGAADGRGMSDGHGGIDGHPGPDGHADGHGAADGHGGIDGHAARDGHRGPDGHADGHDGIAAPARPLRRGADGGTPISLAGARAGHGLLFTLPDHVAREVARLSRTERLEAGRMVRHEPGALPPVRFVREGLLSVLGEAGGPQVELASVGSDGVAGIAAVLGGTREGGGILPLAPTVVETIEAADFAALVKTHEALREAAMREAGRRLREVTQIAACNTRHRLDQRLARWLIVVARRLGEEGLAVTHRDLAMLLGVRRASVTDAIHLLEGAGAVIARRGSLAVRDREVLERHSCGCHRPIISSGAERAA